MTEEGHVGMDLIGDHQEMMLVAKISQSLQRCPVPSDSSWIVGIAEHKHLALLVVNLFEVVEVHLVIAVLTHLQRIEDHLSPIAFGSQAERMVYRWLDDDLLVFMGENVDHHADALDDARDKLDPLTLHVPLMMAVYPVDDARQEIFRLHGIAEKRMLHALLERICNKGRSLEIHVCHPQRQ